MKTTERTKARLELARNLAEETFPERKDDPAIISALVQSLAVDDLTDSLATQFDELSSNICQAAAVASGG